MAEDNELHHAKDKNASGAASTQGDDRKTFLGQTAGTWYIYWICGVASLANIFQGFDSGIYTIIIAEKAFIERFNITGSRQGAVASMISMLHHCSQIPTRDRSSVSP
jgi:3-methyladenine DNA glycosylase Mpg